MENNQQKRPYKLGLVLSGGGARGFAHLGVYKAMQELGIKPDIISGTSAGAIAGRTGLNSFKTENCSTSHDL